MEPKDLKNSEELKSTEKSEPINSDVEATIADNTNEVENEKVVDLPVENTTEESTEQVTEDVAQEEKTSETVTNETEVVEQKPDTIEVESKTEDSTTDEPDEKEEESVAEREPINYSKYTQVELINAFRDILEETEKFDIKNDVEAIKAVFYKNLNESIEEAKTKFVEAGGNIEDFKPDEDPYEKDIKDLLRQYRQIKINYSKKLESEKEENLKKKYEVIEKIKGLINAEESINKTFNDFRDLQKDWREIGLVPQSEMKNLWDTYHFHVENFYDYIKINRELRDLDLKKNMEAKIKLCERAEELLVKEPSIIKAFNTLQKYHDQWREIGPVPREQKDDIWERFKDATTKINKKHQEFFENRKEEQKKNLDAKIALCEKVEEILQEEISTHKDWDNKSKQLIELQQVWRTLGFAPRKDNTKIYERFRAACDKFFDAKRTFYNKNKEEQQTNLQLKTELCLQAESLKESTDWKKTTQDLINIQNKWKEIGPVPRKHSDSLWKRFRSACDYFFDKKSEHFSGLDSEQDDNLKLKEELIAEVQNYVPSDDNEKNLSNLKEFQRRWSEIGHVPFKKKDEVMGQFREAINKLFDQLNMDDSRRNLLRFKSKMTSFSESMRGQNKMRMERDKYMNKMKQLENDLVLLDNNIGFFAKSKNADALIADVKKKIEVTKQKIELLKDKIRVIDEMDNDDE